MLKQNIELYRPCVGLCVINSKQEVFIAHRYRKSDPSNESIAFIEYMEKEEGRKIDLSKGSHNKDLILFKDSLWQMPQGGIDKGEDIEQAAKRELYEETGISSTKILKISEEWYFYDLPEEVIKRSWNGRYIGQRQKWILMQFLGEETEINLDTHSHKEFDKWMWVSPSMLPLIVVSFKRKVYEQVLKEFFKIDD